VAIVFRNQSASEKWSHPEHGKRARRHSRSLDTFRRTRVGKTWIETCNTGQTLKGNSLVAIIAIFGQRKIGARVIAALRVNPEQFLWMTKRKRPYQNCVHYRKRCDRRANPKRESDHRHQ